MIVVWTALAAIAGYEVWALVTGRPTWSDLISDALRGHPIKQAVVLILIGLVAVHLVFGWFNRHHHRPPAPTECGDDT